MNFCYAVEPLIEYNMERYERIRTFLKVKINVKLEYDLNMLDTLIKTEIQNKTFFRQNAIMFNLGFERILGGNIQL